MFLRDLLKTLNFWAGVIFHKLLTKHGQRLKVQRFFCDFLAAASCSFCAYVLKGKSSCCMQLIEAVIQNHI